MIMRNYYIEKINNNPINNYRIVDKEDYDIVAGTLIRKSDQYNVIPVQFSKQQRDYIHNILQTMKIGDIQLIMF